MPCRLAIATCLDLPEPDVDEEVLMTALEEAGFDARLAAWDDPSVRWNEFDLCVIRSTWNYPEAPNEFRAWVEMASQAVPMLNPANVLLENVDKRYLLDLQAAGVSIVPTEYFERGQGASSHPWQRAPFVVKPTISAGSWMTRRFAPSELEDGQEFLQGHLEARDMMVQPYLESVEQGGETAWIWIDGEVTHGVRKAPRFEEDEEAVSEAVEPTPEIHDLVRFILSKVEAELLYARIDLIESGGLPLLSEMELVEPSLFFKQNPRALDRFVAAVKRRIV